MSENGEYDVGYKKPPKANEWKPGQSGNPKGRPKKIKDLDKLLDQELSQTIRITDNGQTLPMTKREVLIKTLVNGALKGDRAALKLVFGFMKTQHTVEGFVPDDSDHAALMALMEKTQLGEEEPEEPPNG